MPKPYIELNAKTLFWRLSLIFFLVIEFRTWGRLRRRVRQAHRLIFFLVYTPLFYLRALFLAGVITLVLWLFIRYVVRPMALSWRAPRTDDSAGLFHLQPRETILATIPAQWRTEWGWRAGTLLRTNERLRFFPEAWDAEPLTLELSRDLFARLVPTPWVPHWLVRNWPPRLVVQTNRDESAVFAVADPEAVLSWFPVKDLEPLDITL